MTPVTPISGGVTLQLHIQPRASNTEMAGLHGGAIKVRVKSPPVDGAANEELLRFLALTLRVPRNQLALIAGQTGRRKAIRVMGVSAETVARCLGIRVGG